MSQLITTGGAPAPAQPATEIEAQPDQTPSPEERTQAVDLGGLIRMEREAREAAKQRESRAKSLEAELAQARKELESVKKSAAFEDDPISFGKARGWTREQQLFYGQSLLYDLVPEQAPPDFRQRMFEARMTRKEQEQEARRQQEQEQAQRQQEYQTVTSYMHSLADAIESFDEGSYPESLTWFGEDRETYARSLLATANNLAETAAAQGQVADLRPATVARALEAEVARKMAERDRRAATRKGAVGAQTPGGEQPAAMSTRNMNGSGTPRPPAATDAERVARAAEVAFRNR